MCGFSLEAVSTFRRLDTCGVNAAIPAPPLGRGTPPPARCACGAVALASCTASTPQLSTTAVNPLALSLPAARPTLTEGWAVDAQLFLAAHLTLSPGSTRPTENLDPESRQWTESRQSADSLTVVNRQSPTEPDRAQASYRQVPCMHSVRLCQVVNRQTALSCARRPAAPAAWPSTSAPGTRVPEWSTFELFATHRVILLPLLGARPHSTLLFPDDSRAL